MLRIGPKRIDTNMLLAPLSGCSDLAFRLICREHGAGFCFFEMLDANCVVRDKCEGHEILKPDARDRPIAAQLLGADPSMMADAARKIFEAAGWIEFLDINCACPVKKVIKKKTGAYLLRNKENMAEIIRAVSSAIPVPVTVKIRIGYDRADNNDIAETVRICGDSGASCIFVHGRTALQGYAGEVNYPAIRHAKRSVCIPVVGSGNVFTPQLAKKMLDETGCDGIMFARGAMGNPWIFKRTEEYIRSGRAPEEPDKGSKLAALKKHLLYVKEFRGSGERENIGFMRKVALWYLRSFPGAAEARQSISRIRNYADMIKIIDGC